MYAWTVSSINILEAVFIQKSLSGAVTIKISPLILFSRSIVRVLLPSLQLAMMAARAIIASKYFNSGFEDG